MVNTARETAQNAAATERNTPGMCLMHCRMWAGINPLYPDAATAWKNVNNKHRDDRTPPRGAPVYWIGGSQGFGHIAISLGGGWIRSTDAGGPGIVATRELGWVERNWGMRYVGWGEDINEVAIPGLHHEVFTSGIRVVTHNVWQGQPASELKANLRKIIRRTHNPRFLSLQEAYRVNGHVVPDGYKRHAEDRANHTESGECVLLVREDVDIVAEHRLQARGGVQWRGPHGVLHDPRMWPAVTAQVDGALWVVQAMHRAYRRGNRKAWVAEHNTLADWFDNRRHPVLSVGDHNGRALRVGPKSLRALAVGAEGHLDLIGIDGALAIDCDTETHRLDGLYGSDHHRPVVVKARQRVDRWV